MDFVEISVCNIQGEAAEAVSNLFNQLGYGGAVVEAIAPDFRRVTVRTVVPAEEDAVLREIEVVLALMDKALPAGLPEPELRFVGEHDWAEAWKVHFHTVRIGRNLVVKPSWRDYHPEPEDIVIELDPGLAFGSGLHPSTQLCLRILESWSLPGLALFDVGAGSGILAIAAVKMGAGPVRAVDVDDVALRVARENFERNRVSVDSAVGSAADNGGRQWQIVVANILPHILIDLMADLARALAFDGRLLLSGIIASHEAEVVAAVQAQRLAITERESDGDWIALVVTPQRQARFKNAVSSPHPTTPPMTIVE
ncbi:MAG: 50S ribosomal protein L11 methyltransferase [Anaerolineae bacterium]